MPINPEDHRHRVKRHLHIIIHHLELNFQRTLIRKTGTRVHIDIIVSGADGRAEVPGVEEGALLDRGEGTGGQGWGDGVGELFWWREVVNYCKRIKVAVGLDVK